MIGLLNEGLLSLLGVFVSQISPSGIPWYIFPHLLPVAPVSSMWIAKYLQQLQPSQPNPTPATGTENLFQQHLHKCWQSLSDLGHMAIPEIPIWENGFTDGLSQSCSRWESAWNNSTQCTQLRMRKGDFFQGTASDGRRRGEWILEG